MSGPTVAASLKLCSGSMGSDGAIASREQKRQSSAWVSVMSKLASDFGRCTPAQGPFMTPALSHSRLTAAESLQRYSHPHQQTYMVTHRVLGTH